MIQLVSSQILRAARQLWAGQRTFERIRWTIDTNPKLPFNAQTRCLKADIGTTRKPDPDAPLVGAETRVTQRRTMSTRAASSAAGRLGRRTRLPGCHNCRRLYV